MNRILLAAVFALSVAGTARAQDTAPVHSELKVGDPAPAFTATAHDGTTVSLADFKGKRVVMWFYPKANTGG